MSGRRFKLAKLAEKDLDDIWLSIAQHNLDRADKVLDEIQARFLLLSQFREMGYCSGRNCSVVAEFSS